MSEPFSLNEEKHADVLRSDMQTHPATGSEHRDDDTALAHSDVHGNNHLPQNPYQPQQQQLLTANAIPTHQLAVAETHHTGTRD